MSYYGVSMLKSSARVRIHEDVLSLVSSPLSVRLYVAVCPTSSQTG